MGTDGWTSRRSTGSLQTGSRKRTRSSRTIKSSTTKSTAWRWYGQHVKCQRQLLCGWNETHLNTLRLHLFATLDLALFWKTIVNQCSLKFFKRLGEPTWIWLIQIDKRNCSFILFFRICFWTPNFDFLKQNRTNDVTVCNVMGAFLYDQQWIFVSFFINICLLWNRLLKGYFIKIRNNKLFLTNAWNMF